MVDPISKQPIDTGGPIPMRTTVTHLDGFTETYEYDGRQPPDFSKGDFGGPQPVATGWNQQQKDDFDKAIKQETTGVRDISTGRGGHSILMPDGSIQTVTEAAPIAPHVQALGDGSFLLIAADGTSDFIRDANGNKVTDPSLLAKHAAELGLNSQQILTAIQAREVAASQENRAGQQQSFNQGQTGFENTRQLVQDRGTQTANDLANVINLAVNLPAQQAANERAAALARSNEANQRVAAAINGETLARGAGTDAVSDAQWMLQHSAPAGFTQQLGQMQASPGLQPNFAAPGMSMPMPDLTALRRNAQGEQRQFIPNFSAALASSQAQPVAAPDINALWSFYGNPDIRGGVSLYSNQVPLPYPTDMHPYLLQNPGPYTGNAAISGAPTPPSPNMWDQQGYYTGAVATG
jgi:hypothetical protein